MAGLVVLAACGGHSSAPTPTPAPVPGPSVQCPSDETVQAGAPTPTVVTYAPPATSGGKSPVETKCTIPSGSAFPIGTSDVICTATDAISRQSSCVFHVTVTFSAQLEGTRFLAFGDSITGGEVAPPTSLFEYRPDQSYPTVLAQLLGARYTAHTISMTNCGQYGEEATKDTNRLKSVLAGGPCGPTIDASARLQAAGSFDALLLLEGTNDLNGHAEDPAIVSKVREALRADIRYAKSAGVQQIFLSTLPPEFALGGDLVPDMNDAIRSLAASENVVLVDSYTALGGARSTLIGVGGIHPTAQGGQVMAQAFLTAIVANFEVPPGTTTTARRTGR